MNQTRPTDRTVAETRLDCSALDFSFLELVLRKKGGDEGGPLYTRNNKKVKLTRWPTSGLSEEKRSAGKQERGKTSVGGGERVADRGTVGVRDDVTFGLARKGVFLGEKLSKTGGNHIFKSGGKCRAALSVTHNYW